jgi:uncharacterized spore protein YtfJ
MGSSAIMTTGCGYLYSDYEISSKFGPTHYNCNLKTLHMENENFIENIATRLGQSATVKNVYGEPITSNGKTIIPVAQVAFGFGGGYGHKNLENKKQADSESEMEHLHGKKGGGGGGGMVAKAKGVYEVTAKGTRFIPANNTRQLLMAALIGFLIKGWLLRRANR